MSAQFREAVASEMPEILGVLVRNAKAGDVAAARLLIDRLWPSLRPESLPIKLRGLDVGPLAQRAEVAMTAMGTGLLSIDQAAGAIAALGGVARLKEAEELEGRLAALERALEAKTWQA